MKQYEPLSPATLERIKGYIQELGYQVVTFNDGYRIVGEHGEIIREEGSDFALTLFALGHLHEKHVAFVESIAGALKELSK